MKPAPFSYYRPPDLNAALQVLSSPEWNGRARILAGGQSLVPALATRDARPALVIDIMHCPGQEEIALTDDSVAIGATCRQSKVEHSPIVKRHCPLIADAIGWIAVPQVRSRGTVVGSLVQANPGGELPVVAVTLGAKFEVMSLSGPSIVDAKEFYGVPSGTTLSAESLVAKVHFRVLRDGEGWGFSEIQLRRGHFALVCAAATMVVRDGQIQSASLGLGGLTASPYRSAQAEALLAGQNIANDEALTSAAAMAVKERPWASRSDLHASAEYREKVAVIAGRNALLSARQRALQPHRETLS
jgi:carbon-monoxide dehydrogenase medium subunit